MENLKNKVRDGDRNWVYSGIMDVDKKIDGYGLRYCSKESKQWANSRRLGWTPVNEVTAGSNRPRASGKVDETRKSSQSSVFGDATEVGDLVLCAMSEKDCKRYYDVVREETRINSAHLDESKRMASARGLDVTKGSFVEIN